MEGLITSWLLAPGLLVLISCGLSLLIERAANVELPWTLRPALGAAVIIVLAQLGTLSEGTAPLTLPAIALLGVVGWVVWLFGGRLSGCHRDHGLGMAVGALVFGIYALPFFVHGEATWAGYIKLDDTATFMAMADWAFEHGRIPPESALGSYAVTIQDNLGAGYPIGSFTPAALMAWLPGQDIAWTIQPGMAFGAACLAMVLYEVGRRTLIEKPAAAAMAAICASFSALLLGYYLWGGVKELAAAPLIALGPAIALVAIGPGAGVLLGITAAGLIGALGLGAGIWVAPIYLLLVVDVWRRAGGREAFGLGAPAAGLGALLSLPAIFTPAGLFNPLQGGLTSETELGNLAEPVSIGQLAGLWPALDFRQEPAAPLLVGALAVVVVAAATWAVWRSRPAGAPSGDSSPPDHADHARQGSGAFVALVLGGLVAALATVLVGSPWVGAKALATFSPVMLFAGICGLLTLMQTASGRRARQVLAGGLTLAVVAVVAWGSVEAYLGISFAPRAHYEELAEIGEEFAGQGPALSTEVSVSGPRHFLRELDADAAGGRRAHQVLTREGEPHPSGAYLDISEIRPDQLRDFRLLILRRTPLGSRPPSEFELAWRGNYYDVWRQLPDDGVGLIQDLHLSDGSDPGAMPRCDQLFGLARMSGPEGILRAAPVGGTPLVLDIGEVELPDGWQALGPDTFSPLNEGELRAEITAAPGRYRVWIGGEIYGGLGLTVDGRSAGSLRGAVNNGGGLEPLREIELEGPSHVLELSYSAGDLHPGSAFKGTWSPFPVGPVILEPIEATAGAEAAPIFTVPASRYRNICGRRWDWVEARAPA